MLARTTLLLLWSAFAGDLSARPTEPLPIVGGDEALTCEFPSVAALVVADEQLRCSATLVHPEVVVTAAHCFPDKEQPVVGIAFGEAVDVGMQVPGGTPERVIPVANCEVHPEYAQRGAPDVAYCRLSEPVLDVPRIPLLAGCELDALQPGVEVTIAGFGATFAEFVEGPDGRLELVAEGAGPKRYTTQTIDLIDLEFGIAAVVGPNGSQSACSGDSGGPAMVEMADGTWRVFGAGSILYTPENELPPPEIPGNLCGPGTVYALLSLQLEWLETQSGFDLTPCHDDDGNWSPQEGCGGFPVSPGVASGSWANGCAGGPIGGGEPLCEDVAGTSGGTTGEGETDASTGDSDSTSTSAGEEGGTGTMDSSTASGGGDSASAGTTGRVGDEESSGGAAETGDDTGCGCRAASGSRSLLASVWLLGLLLLRRRRVTPRRAIR